MVEIYNPTEEQDISGLVPYTGATGNVDLGAHNITATTFIGALTGTASGNQPLNTILTSLAGLSNASGVLTNNGSGGLSWGAGGGGGMAIGGSITSATAGSVLFAGASGVLAQDNSNLFYDYINHRLGIGTTAPGYALQVNVTANTNAGIMLLPKDGWDTGRNVSLFMGAANHGITSSYSGNDLWQGYNGLSFLNAAGTTLALGTDAFGGTGNVGIGGNITNLTTFAGASVIIKNGNVCIGLTSPTAYLNIKAGTATAGTAPIKLTSGVLNTTAETGALEYNGTNLSFVPTGTLRENIHTGGRGNKTLTAGTSTTVTDATAKTTSTIILSPTSLAVIALSPYVSTKNNGSFVITTLTALGTETLDYLIIN
jgi:hypothetical protein